MSSMAGGGAGAAWQVLAKAHETEMRVYMSQIYTALRMYSDDNDGRLPTADLYPDIRKDPQACVRSGRSIRRILQGYAGDPKIWVAHHAPERFKKAGLTYVWNPALNGKTIESLPGRTWLLMDMNGAGYAIPDLIPRNQNGYLVLWTDGQVKLERTPPVIVKEADAAKLKDQVKAMAPATGADGVAPGAPGTTPGTQPGGEAPKPVPAATDPVLPKDPDAEVRKKEEGARRSNPDEDDAVHE
jgi:hypothetical protein